MPGVGTDRSPYDPGFDDLETGQGGGHLLRGAQDAGVMRAAGAAIEIAAVMADVEQRAAWTQRNARGREGALTLVPRELQIADQREVVVGPTGAITPHVGLHPLHAHTPSAAQTTGLRQADGGEVDGCYAPSVCGEPDRVLPLTGP